MSQLPEELLKAGLDAQRWVDKLTGAFLTDALDGPLTNAAVEAVGELSLEACQVIAAWAGVMMYAAEVGAAIALNRGSNHEGSE